MRTEGSSELFVVGSKLTYGEELAWVSTVLSTGLTRLLVLVRVQIVVMNVLGVVLSVSSASVRVDTAVW